MALLTSGIPRNCPVEGCPVRTVTRTLKWVHLFHRHVRDIPIIFYFPHPWCPQCNILVPWRALNKRHLATSQFSKGEERNQRRLAEKELQESTEMALQAYGKPLDTWYGS